MGKVIEHPIDDLQCRLAICTTPNRRMFGGSWLDSGEVDQNIAAALVVQMAAHAIQDLGCLLLISWPRMTAKWANWGRAKCGIEVLGVHDSMPPALLVQLEAEFAFDNDAHDCPLLRQECPTFPHLADAAFPCLWWHRQMPSGS
jgi:hypothetical protein